MRRFQILVCDGPSCGLTYESDLLRDLLRARVAADPGLKPRVFVCAYNCFGRCSEGPNMFVRPLAPGEDGDVEPRDVAGPGFYPGVGEEKVLKILEQHAGEGVPVAEWVEDY
jgi:(2Fe-2S) ferredoxin